MPDLKKVSPYPIRKGQESEARVAEYLQNLGFQLLHRNFRCKLGEVDLIGIHQNYLAFVEVRFRRNATFGSAAESVIWRKQQKLIRTAQFFLKNHPYLLQRPCRFDVIAVTLQQGNLVIDWIQDAFC